MVTHVNDPYGRIFDIQWTIQQDAMNNTIMNNTTMDNTTMNNTTMNNTTMNNTTMNNTTMSNTKRCLWSIEKLITIFFI